MQVYQAASTCTWTTGKGIGKKVCIAATAHVWKQAAARASAAGAESRNAENALVDPGPHVHNVPRELRLQAGVLDAELLVACIQPCNLLLKQTQAAKLLAPDVKVAGRKYQGDDNQNDTRKKEGKRKKKKTRGKT